MFSEFTYIRTAFLFCTATLLAFVSCDGFINEDYDLSKDIDKTVSGLQGLSVPLGSAKAITVADLFDIPYGETGIVYPDYDGNYIFEQILRGDLRVRRPYIYLTSEFEPIEAIVPVVADDVPFSLSSIMNFEFRLSESITDFKSIEFTHSYSHVILNLRSSEDYVYLKSGFRIIFPEYIHLESIYSYMTIEDGHILICNEDKILPAWIAFNIQKFDHLEGVYTGGTLVLNPEVRIEGELGFKADNMEEIPEDLKLTATATFDRLTPSYAELKGVMECEPDDIEGIKIEDVPEFLSKASTLDIYDPSLLLSIDNDYQFPFALQTATITSHLRTRPESITIGEDPSLIADPESKSRYVISSREKDLAEGYVNIVDPALRDMFVSLPQSLSVNDIKVKVGSVEHFHRFDLRSESLKFPYYIRASLPLSFDEDAYFGYSRVIDIPEVDFDTFTDKVALTMDVVSSIPLELKILVQALDEDGYPVSWIKADDSLKIAPGTQDSPVSTPLTWSISLGREYIKFSSLKFVFVATTSEEYVGLPLNKEQKIELRNLTLHLPDGITIDPDAL